MPTLLDHSPSDVAPLGIIAGEGRLPFEILRVLKEQERPAFIIGFEERTPAELYSHTPHCIISMGAIGKALKAMRQAGVKEVVLAGRVVRPKISLLHLDAGGIKLLYRLRKERAASDNPLLSTIIHFLEEEGFHVLGLLEVAPELLATEGLLTQARPDMIAEADIALGREVVHMLGQVDVGQAVVVQQGLVLGVEAAEGTDALLDRCSSLRQEGKGGVLVKMKKPSQEIRVDLPTIGVTTIEKAYAAGLRGIAVETGATLIIEKERVMERAEKLGLFITGIKAQE